MFCGSRGFCNIGVPLKDGPGSGIDEFPAFRDPIRPIQSPLSKPPTPIGDPDQLVRVSPWFWQYQLMAPGMELP